MIQKWLKDSWAMADKINRIISGNIPGRMDFQEATWLYFENNTLLEWGPVKNQ